MFHVVSTSSWLYLPEMILFTTVLVDGQPLEGYGPWSYATNVCGTGGTGSTRRDGVLVQSVAWVGSIRSGELGNNV